MREASESKPRARLQWHERPDSHKIIEDLALAASDDSEITFPVAYRSGQYFRLVDLDGQVAFYMGELSEGLWYRSLHRLLLPPVVRYLKPLDEIQREVFRFARLPPMNEQKQSPLLAVLPSDVLRLIFDCLGNAYDTPAGTHAASLALACQTTFEAGHATLRKHQDAAQRQQAWAGHHLIVGGDLQNPEDVPACIAPLMPGGWMSPETDIYTETEHWPQAWMDLRDVVDSEVLRRSTLTHGLSDGRDASAADLWQELFDERAPPSMNNPVLRNLDTREYARQDALEAAQAVHEECRPSRVRRGFKDLRIGDLAVFRLCWTSVPALGIAGDEQRISRGSWAGHRFDIVDGSQVQQDEGWTDISDELVREVAEIYKANFPLE